MGTVGGAEHPAARLDAVTDDVDLAVDAGREVEAESAGRLPVLDHLVDPGRAERLARIPVLPRATVLAGRGIEHDEVRGLVLVVARPRKVDVRHAVERVAAVRGGGPARRAAVRREPAREGVVLLGGGGFAGAARVGRELEAAGDGVAVGEDAVDGIADDGEALPPELAGEDAERLAQKLFKYYDDMFPMLKKYLQ